MIIKKPQKKKTAQNIEQEIEPENVFGREMCNCMAKTHKLINNCLSCGRIVCEQEDEGPCFFCGQLVYSKANERQGNQEAELMEQLNIDNHLLDSYYTALSHKQKLLQYEKSSIATKNVVDDETDWYEIKNDIWQDETVRKEAVKQLAQNENIEEENKNYTSYVIDFNTGNVEAINKKIDFQKQKEEAQSYLKDAENDMKKRQALNEIKQKELADVDEVKVVKDVMAELGHKYKDKRNTSFDLSGRYSKTVQHDDVYSDLVKLNENIHN